MSSDHRPPKAGSFRRILRTTLSALSGLLAGLCFWLFHERYWRWREEIHAAKSSFVAPDGANLIAGGAFWIMPALAFLVLALLFARAR